MRALMLEYVPNARDQASRCARRTPHDHRSMPSRRTVRKPTVWTPEEWRHIEEAAVAGGVRPLLYVREAAVAAELPPCTL